jgi:hypothetical protein
MEDEFGKIVSKVIAESDYGYPAGLAAKISIALKKQRLRAARIKAALFSGGSILFGWIFSMAWRFAAQEMSQNGSSRIFSLIFSDFQAVAANWKYFLLSFAETLPVLAAVLVVSSIATFTILFVKTVSSFRKLEKIDHTYSHA